jgi:hypothetical protein
MAGRIWLTDAVKVTYYPRATPAALWRQYLNYGRGRARTVLKHNSPLRLRQALPLAVAPAVLAALAAPLWWPAALPALAWAALCLVYGFALGLQRRDGWAMLSGPAAMIMHLAWSGRVLVAAADAADQRRQGAARDAGGPLMIAPAVTVVMANYNGERTSPTPSPQCSARRWPTWSSSSSTTPPPTAVCGPPPTPGRATGAAGS